MSETIGFIIILVIIASIFLGLVGFSIDRSKKTNEDGTITTSLIIRIGGQSVYSSTKTTDGSESKNERHVKWGK